MKHSVFELICSNLIKICDEKLNESNQKREEKKIEKHGNRKEEMRRIRGQGRKGWKEGRDHLNFVLSFLLALASALNIFIIVSNASCT